MILQRDITSDPEKFMMEMMEVVTHMLLQSTALKYQKLLSPFDPASQ